MKRSKVVETITSLSGDMGHWKVLNVYNSQCPLPRGYRLNWNDAWCAATVSAVMIMNGYDAIAECSCPEMIKKAKVLGIWQEHDYYIPAEGDIIMYDWQDSGDGDNTGTADHTGIVTNVGDRQLVVREGNYNGAIRNRALYIDGKYIRGYITPPYELEIESVIDSLYN